MIRLPSRTCVLATAIAVAPVMPADADPVMSVAQIESRIETRLDALQAAHPEVPGYAMAFVQNNQLVSAATGSADPQGRAMTPDTPVRIASITKTFVAAAILRLWEAGHLDLDAPIGDLLADAHVRLLDADGYDTSAITIRHLLMHASGLNDHAESEAFMAAILANPARVWTRTDQLELMVEHSDPVGAPGHAFHYSDTGYLLLGEIIERTTGKPLSAAVRDLNRFDEIGLSHLRWEGDPASGTGQGARAHQYLGGMDTHGFHGSIDAFGGGGLIASVEDVARYYSALFSGQVFASPQTLALMTVAPGHPADSPYRMGLFSRDFAGNPAFGHGGFWGLEVWAVPAQHTVLSFVTLEKGGLEGAAELATELLNDGLAEAND